MLIDNNSKYKYKSLIIDTVIGCCVIACFGVNIGNGKKLNFVAFSKRPAALLFSLSRSLVGSLARWLARS